MILLRPSKRRTSWEPATPLAQTIEAEFTEPGTLTIDLRLSVYEIEDNQVVQAFAEHAAAAGLDPPSGRLNVDMSNYPPEVHLARVAGESDAFAFVKQQHRELLFPGEADLTAFAEVVKREIGTRGRSVSTDELRAYIVARYAASDPEWTAICDANSNWKRLTKPKPKKKGSG